MTEPKRRGASPASFLVLRGFPWRSLANPFEPFAEQLQPTGIWPARDGQRPTVRRSLAVRMKVVDVEGVRLDHPRMTIVSIDLAGLYRWGMNVFPM